MESVPRPGLPGTELPRRDVLAGATATALGISTLALPAGAVASSVPVATTLVAATGGVVYGWGTNWQSGVLGTVSTSPTAPVEVTGTSFTWPEIVQVVVSRYTSFALARNGDVYASGSNEAGKLGTTAVSTSSFSATPVKAMISDVVQVASGIFWVLALKDSGQVWAWGQSDAASGLTTLTQTPADVTSVLWPTSAPTGTDRVVQLASNYWHSIALTATGRVFTWGRQTVASSPGVLGQDSTGELTSATAVEISGALPGTTTTDSRIIQVSAGVSHSLALGRDGRVYAWGYDNGSQGALGRGVIGSVGSPVDISANGDLAGTVGTAARIVQVSAGQDFSLAVGLDGAVYAWGGPNSGRLGNGTSTGNVLAPQRITGIVGSALPAVSETSRRIVQVSARIANGFALGADARVYGWGQGGRVGDGTSDQRTLPVEITASGVFANLSPNPGASLSPRRIVALATGSHNDAPHMLAIDDRG